MNYNFKILLVFMLLLSQTVIKSQDINDLLNPEIEKLLNEIVVTATKTKRQLSNVTVPVTLIQERDIKNVNAMRIQGVLNEFTGLNTVSSALGTGIQLQGLDSDYSLIMIDGVPMIGRLNGVLDLSRISVSNISHIEIVKGPSSVLFGSNALAGVVNIITNSSKKEQYISVTSKFASFNTYDFGINNVLLLNKYKVVGSFNYYTTGGYDLASNYQGYNVSTNYYGKTVSPHSNYSFSIQNEYKFNDRLKANINFKYFKENESYQFLDSDKNLIDGSGFIKDWSIRPWVTYRWNTKLKTILKYSYNKYNTETNETYTDESLYSSTYYNENYGILEIQNDYKLNKKHEITLGGGYEHEGIQTSRLSSNKIHKADNKFIFFQYILNSNDRLNIILGTRYENHKNYSQQFNPKISLKYNISPKYIIKASVGRGFKKPDFKQLFFNYTNNAIGYSVFGTTYVEEGIDYLLSTNQIQINQETGDPMIYSLYDKILSNGGIIDAENSIGFNLGMSIRSIKNTIVDINLFRNDLENLIETTPIAQKTNGWQAYSYQNINSVYTHGIEIDIKHYLNDHINIFTGFQFLEAKDKNVIKELESGLVFAKDLETGISYKINKSQYGGLLNRAKYNANFKVYLTDIWKGINANFRVFYKGKFGYTDLNTNNILDIDEEYIKSYFLCNTTIQKKFFNDKLTLKFGVDNIFDYTYATPEFTISSLPGRIFYTSINYKFTKK